MRHHYFIVIIIGLFIFVVSGCNNELDAPHTSDEEKAIAYVKSKGYKIVSNLGELDTYTLNQEMIVRLPYMSSWSLQENEPDHYFGKTITTYAFVVTDHPLEKKYDSIPKENDYEIQVHIMLSEGRVIGGTSSPVSKDGAMLLGGGYSLDGKELEEITGMSYSEWLESWVKKYGE